MKNELTVAETIQLLKNTIAQLELKDPEAPVLGHVAYPKYGYSGDLDGSIFKIEVEDHEGDEEGGVVLGIYHL